MAKDAKKESMAHFIRVLEECMDIVIEQTRVELRQQGHVNTGELINSIKRKTRVEGNRIIVQMWLAEHFEVVNDGVRSSRIPYSGPSGRGGTSRYIEGLTRYFIQRGKNSVEAKRAAFATANRHKMEGMPTRGSYRFSSNGRRRGFLDQSVKDTRSEVQSKVGTLAALLQQVLREIVHTYKELELKTG